MDGRPGAGLYLDADPLTVVDRTLRHVVARHKARGGAVLLVRGEQLVPYAVRDVTLDRLSVVRQVWAARMATLRSGQLLAADEHLVASVRDRDRLVALLFLDAPQVARVTDLGELLATLARALVADEAAVGESTPITPPVRPSGREALVRTLAANEWNISRAARLLGVTRRTIYLRLVRYGIPRQKVPKTQKA